MGPGLNGLLRGDLEEHVASAGGEVHDVPVLGHGRGDVLGGLDSSQQDQSLARLVDGLGDDGRRLCLTLCTDDGGLSFLLGSLDDELGSFGLCKRCRGVGGWVER